VTRIRVEELAREVNVAVNAGGGGTGGELTMDYAAQQDAEITLTATADDLDSAAPDIPAGDYGEAAEVVATLLSAYTDVGGRLVTEAKALAVGVRAAAGHLATTDEEQAVDFKGIVRDDHRH
jgi:hypothetical protein